MTNWRDIPDHPGYQASNDGRIRSIDRVIADTIGRRRKLRGVVLATFPDDKGYLRVGFGHVHRFICMAFHGAPEATGLHAAHRDGNNQNNHPDNLYWATIAENNRDILRHGRHHHANKTHCPRGHEYTTENTYGDPNKRACRQCHYERCRAYREANREKVRATGLASYYRRKAAS